MKPIIAIAFFSITLLLTACSSSVSVFIEKKNAKDRIIIDNKDTLPMKDSVLTIQLSEGTHLVKINDEPNKDFIIGDKGGILNLGNREYVAYEIEYAAEKKKSGFNFNSLVVKSVLLIDSFVITSKKGVSFVSDSSLKNIIPELLAAKNGNYYFGHDKGYDTNDRISGLKKFGKDQLFINKFWDYTTTKEIPETVEIQQSKYSVMDASATRTAIMHANMFLFAAMMTSDEYIVRSIKAIEAGENDKMAKKQEETKEAKVEEKQMKF